MKTALDLPDELVREVKMHAVRQKRKLKDIMAELLRRGLDASVDQPLPPSAQIGTHPLTGLPILICRHPAAAGEQLTPARLSEILLTQEADWSREASR